MECKKVQDRLITDYLDKELGGDERIVIEKHLAACSDCREFFATVQETAVVPFKETVTLQPDGVVWEKIEARIEAEHSHSENVFWKLADALAPLMRMSQPVFRAAFVTALILIIAVFAKWPHNRVDPLYNYMSEQMAFMGELGAGNTDLLNGDLKDYDAAFEEMIG